MWLSKYVHNLSVKQLVQKLLAFKCKKCKIRLGTLSVGVIQSPITFEPFVSQTSYAQFWKAECCGFPNLCIVCQ